MARSENLVGDWYSDTNSGIGHGSEAQTPLALGVTDVTPPKQFRDIEDALQEIDTSAHKYTDHIVGRVDTREAIVDGWLHNDRLAEPIPVSEDSHGHPCVAITAGGQAAIHHAVNATLSEGEKALLIEPFYPYHKKSVRVFRTDDAITTIETDAEERFHPPIEKIRQTIDQEPIGTIVLCSPGNPTGVQYDSAWLADVASIANEENLSVISDEVYAFLTYGNKPHRSIATFPGMAERTLVIGSFSKVFGLSGWRLGFIRAPKAMMDPLTDVIDAVSMQSVTPGQVLLERTLRSDDPMAKAEEAAQRFETRMESLVKPFEASDKTTVHRPTGGFYVFPTVAESYRQDLSNRGGYDTAVERLPGAVEVSAGDCLYYHLLENAGVEGVPGRIFGKGLANDAVRFAFGDVSVTEVNTAAERITHALETF